jgi:hypothetical protein
MEAKILNCVKNGNHLVNCDDDGFCNSCGYQDQVYFYEIHVIGKNSFSTSIVVNNQLDDDDIIMEAINQDKIESEDIHFIDYIEELSYREWNNYFNFK